MADWKEWLKRGQDWAGRTVGAYKAADQQANGLGGELAAKAQMVDQGRAALAEPMAIPTAAPAMSDYGMSPLTSVNPGYQPIGGENALRDLYAGHPPALLPSPAAKRPLIK